MTFDNDVQVEGVSQIYSRDIKNSFLKNITFSAWQLPMLERGTTFVRNANGTINIEESERGGRDLGLFGAQLQGRFALNSKTNLTLSVADLYYANTDAINPIQVFGANLQLPVTITIPASGTTPAQTISTVVNVPREFLVSGNGNLGLSAAANNAVNRNGRLSSGYNLVDFMAQFDFKQLKYNPMTLILNYVRNTQTRDVVVAGAGGANVFLPNNENDGVWAEFRIQNLRKKRGMTCVQCHVRNFDEENYLTDMRDPQKNSKDFATNPVPRVFFIITPTLHNGRPEYIRRGEAEQVGSLQGVFRDYLGIKVKINSPLVNDWVHNTKKGKS